MSFAEDRPNSSGISIPGQKRTSGLLRTPGLVTEHSPADQLPFSDPPRQYGGLTRPIWLPTTSPGVTRQLPDLESSVVTRSLPELETGALPAQRTTAALRQPIVIRGTSKRPKGSIKPPHGRRWVIQIAVSLMLVMIALAALMAVAPAGLASESNNSLFQVFMNWSQSGNNSPSLLSMQEATVTAAVQNTSHSSQPANGTNTGGVPVPTGSSSGDAFPVGQCTYGADLYYHQLAGIWVPWGGDAWTWAAGARAYGWNVSSTPIVPSIIVLQPFVQGASGLGHVAVVVKINSDGSVLAMNMNWYANGGGWDRWSYWTFTPGPGVSFVWK